MEASCLEKDIASSSGPLEGVEVPRKNRARFPIRLARRSPYLRMARASNHEISPKRCRHHLDLCTDEKAGFSRMKSFKRVLRRSSLSHLSDILKMSSWSDNKNGNNNRDEEMDENTNKDCSPIVEAECEFDRLPEDAQTCQNGNNAIDNESRKTTKKLRVKKIAAKINTSPPDVYSRRRSLSRKPDGKEPAKSKSNENADVKTKLGKPGQIQKRKLSKTKTKPSKTAQKEKENPQPIMDAQVKTPIELKIVEDECEPTESIVEALPPVTPVVRHVTPPVEPVVRRVTPIAPSFGSPVGAEGDACSIAADWQSVKSTRSGTSIHSAVSSTCGLPAPMPRSEPLMKVQDDRRATFKAEVQKFLQQHPELRRPERECTTDENVDLATGDVILKEAESKLEEFIDECNSTISEIPKLDDDVLNAVAAMENPSTSFKLNPKLVFDVENAQGYQLYGLCFLIAATAAYLYHGVLGDPSPAH